MKVLTVAAGTSGNIKMSYTPEFLGFKTGGSTFRVTGTREGTGTLLNLDEYGVAALGQTLSQTYYDKNNVQLIPVADGYVNGGFFLELNNTGGVDVEVFAFSTKKGNCFVSSIIDTAVQNTSTRYERFLKLVAGRGTDPADIVTHFYRMDESKQAVLVTYDEVNAISALHYDNAQFAFAPYEFITWDNTAQELSAVVIQPAANNVTTYLQRLIA